MNNESWKKCPNCGSGSDKRGESSVIISTDLNTQAQEFDCIYCGCSISSKSWPTGYGWTTPTPLEEIVKKLNRDPENIKEENHLLRKIISNILKHADSPDMGPPLKFTVEACREIRDKLKALL